MNKIDNLTTPLMWLMALLLAALVAGCGGSSASGGGSSVVSTPIVPVVSFTFPVDSATGVALNTSITANFSEVMKSSTITSVNFTLADAATPVPGTVTYAGTTATFKPTTSLAASTVYTATITTGVQDAAGNALAAIKTWNFTTGSAADSTAPTVSSTLPANTDNGVALNANINANFSEPMDATTITDTSFTLMQGATLIPGAVTFVGTSAAFNPDADLAPSLVYTATITTAVKDLAGNPLAATKTWSFTTGTAVAAGAAPVLLGKAGDFAILAKAGVSTVPTSVVTGNVGVSPVARTYLTGWSLITEPTDTSFTSAQVVSPGKLYAADNVGGTTSADLGTAVLNMGTAYTDAAGRTATSAATTNVGSGTLTSLTLAPGVYQWSGAVHIPTDLTLSGSATDVWIFKVGTTLDMAAAKNVILIGGAQAKNVFWQTAGAVTIGANTHFEGIMLGQTSISFGNLASIKGRLLSQTQVTLDATTVTQP